MTPAERKRRQRQRAMNEDGEFVTVTAETVLAALLAGVRDLAAAPVHGVAVDHLIDRASGRFEVLTRYAAEERIRALLTEDR